MGKENDYSKLLELCLKYYNNEEFLTSKEYYIRYIQEKQVRLSATFLEFTLDLLLTLNQLNRDQDIIEICTLLLKKADNVQEIEEWEIALKSSLGIAYKNSNKFHKSIDIFKELVNKYPERANIHYLLGTINEEMGDIDSAFKYYKEAIELESESTEILHGLRVCYQKKERYSDLENVCERILQLNPEDLSALNSLAIISMEKGNYEKAIRILNQVIEKDNYFVAAWFNLGIAYVETEKLRKAIEAFNIVLEFEPHNIDALSLLAKAYLDNKDYQQAINAFEQLIEKDEVKVFYLLGLAYSHIYISEISKALKYLKQTLELDPNSEEAQFLKERIEEKLENR